MNAKDIMSLNSTDVFNTAPIPTIKAPIPDRSPIKIHSPGKFVLGLFATNKVVDHFMLVNTDYLKEANVRFQVPGTSLQEFDPATSTWHTVEKAPSNNCSSISLSAGDGRLFRFN